jgi:hypothetical protein
VSDITYTPTEYNGQRAVRITADEPRKLREIRRELEGRGFWTLTTNDPTYSLLAPPEAALPDYNPATMRTAEEVARD